MYDIAPHNKWYWLIRTISHLYRPHIKPNVAKTNLLFRFFFFIGLGASIYLILFKCESWLPFFLFKYIVPVFWKYLYNQPLLSPFRSLLYGSLCLNVSTAETMFFDLKKRVCTCCILLWCAILVSWFSCVTFHCLPVYMMTSWYLYNNTFEMVGDSVCYTCNTRMS